VPAEADVSIRPGWFWHQPEDSQIKTPEKLLDIWFKSVGRGANLILNVPPDKTGRLRDGDVKSLVDFRSLRDDMLSKNLAAGARVTGPTRGGDSRYSPEHLTDGNIESYWATDDGAATPTAEIYLNPPVSFDVIRLREQIRLGQRVDAFVIDAWLDGAWKEIHAGRTIGNQVMVRLADPVTTNRLRLRITESAATPCISEFSLYRLPGLRPASGE
jgi:alpha-L-fucosidase